MYTADFSQRNVSRPGVSRLTMLAGALAMVGSAGADPLFTDVTVDAGISGFNYRGATNHTLGAAWIDFNNDGWDDIFIVNGFGEVPHLFQNNKNGTFSNADALLPAFNGLEMSGVIFADYDNDGDSDMFIPMTNEQWDLQGFNEHDGPADILLQNQWVENGNQIIDGQPLFIDVAAAAGVDGVLDVPLGTDYPGRRGMTGGWLDYNRDGCVDLFVGNLTLQAPGEVTNLNRFYENNCDGTFTDVTDAAGLNPSTDHLRPSLAFMGADLSNDGWPDMFVVNVHEAAPFFEDIYFENNGNGTFTDRTAASPGVGNDAGSGMGIDIADINNDGFWDIYMSDVFTTVNDEPPFGNPLYLGSGNGTWFDNTADSAGVAAAFSWGTIFADYDNDGYEDLYVCAGENDFLYMNNTGDGTFTDMTDIAGISELNNGRGAVSSDYDHDGDLDILVVDQNADISLLRNDSTNAGNSVIVGLTGTESNADAIGAVVKATVGGMTMMRTIKGGSSAHSQGSLAVHFGIGTASAIDTMEIHWPSGQKQTFNNVPANTAMGAVEPNLPRLSASPTGVPIELNSTVTFQLSGAGFMPNMGAGLLRAGSTRINDFTFIDANTVQFTITAVDTARLGPRTAVLNNPDGSRILVRNLFEVVAPPVL